MESETDQPGEFRVGNLNSGGVMNGNRTVLALVLMAAIAGLVCMAGSYAAAEEKKGLKPGVQPLERQPAATSAVVPRQLPDLIVERCWQAKGCRFVCRFKNIGTGRIPDDQHGKAQAHISAGLENPALRNPVPLKRIDPAGSLKPPGGSVDYDTGCIAKAAATGLVWIDTNHKIAELNETNNGANPRLTNCPW
ncbi:hypothetical protein [Desulfofustis glycolicus]|nr:hypothetical protein [Desulfofustis glycolicus]